MPTGQVPKNTAILLVSCPDQRGLVATIADFVYRHNGNILHADEHADEGSNLFLMRVEFDPGEFSFELADFARHFTPVAERFNMTWRLAQSARRPRMAILVSRYDHCLVDLLYRHHSGELTCDVPVIISNHPDNKPIAEFYGIPYETVRELSKKGHDVRFDVGGYGGYQAIRVEMHDGQRVYVGASESRKDGQAAGY